jgi:deoxyribonuclease IV
MSPAPEALFFGPAGVPLGSEDASTISGIEHTSVLGLDCQEIEFVNGVKMGLDTARKVAAAAAARKIRLSAHAPYFINLSSEDRGKRLQSQERILATARVAHACGATSVVFHAGFYGHRAPEETFGEIKRELSQVVSILRSERVPVTLRVETMGKKSQFGTLEEVLNLCREIDGLQPCLDFSHLHAREGRVNSYDEFSRVLSKVEKKLGRSALRNVHIHISGSHYSEAGELKHLDLVQSDFCYDDWIEALSDFDVRGSVICESPNREEDALMLKALYRAQKAKADNPASSSARD